MKLTSCLTYVIFQRLSDANKYAYKKRINNILNEGGQRIKDELDITNLLYIVRKSNLMLNLIMNHHQRLAMNYDRNYFLGAKHLGVKQKYVNFGIDFYENENKLDKAKVIDYFIDSTSDHSKEESEMDHKIFSRILPCLNNK